MKNLEKLSALLLLLALAFSLVACGGTDAPADTTPAVVDTTTADVPASSEEPAAKDLTIIENGVPSVTLVRPEKATESEISTFSAFSKSLIDLCDSGKMPKLITDRFDDYDPEKPEIYIGKVNMPELRTARNTVAYNAYCVKVVGSKLVVGAWSDLGYQNACAKLAEKLPEMMKDGTLVIPADFELKGSVAGYTTIAEAPVYPYGTFNSVMNCADNTFIAIIDETSREEFDSYTSSLSGNAYTLYTENNINDNIFRSYTRDDTLLHAYYIPHSEQVRIIVSENANLPDKTAPAIGEAKCAPTVTQLGISQYHAADGAGTVAAGGMGYVLRLSDGSFIIVDGGHNYVEDYEDLIKLLDEQAIDKSHIVIRAWIITHFHTDHIGTFYYFAKQQSKNGKYEIQSFLINTVAVTEQCQVTALSSMQKPLQMMKQYYPNVPIYKPFAGQKYYFNDAVVNVLYTYDDFLPEILDDDGNKTTMVVQVELAGQKLMFLGDTTKWNCDEMSVRYGSALKSDFVQMAHHGFNEDRARARNATTQIYQLIDPAYVFWPCTENAYKQRYVNPVNNYLLTKLHVKQLWVADKNTVTVTLPYTGSGPVLH